MAIINFNKITHSYGSNIVLDQLDMLIDTQKITCLLGNSGSGKTTILRLIAGLELPDSGTIVIDNQIVTNNNTLIVPPHLRQVGFVFQDLALWPHFSVYKNIAFGLQERKETDVAKKVMEILNFFHIDKQAKKYPHQLSGGQKQLVAIARALVLRPKILLMDEPLANLDVKLKYQILQHIKNLQKHFDLTVVYVTHDHKEAFSIADKIIVLNQGKIELSGSVSDIQNTSNEYIVQNRNYEY